VQQLRDDLVLVGFGQRCERGARHAPLEEQHDRLAEPLARVQPHGSVAVPAQQALPLVHRLEMRPADLEHDVAPGAASRRSDPRRGTARLEGLIDLQRPLSRDLPHQTGKLVEPGAHRFVPRSPDFVEKLLRKDEA